MLYIRPSSPLKGQLFYNLQVVAILVKTAKTYRDDRNTFKVFKIIISHGSISLLLPRSFEQELFTLLPAPVKILLLANYCIKHRLVGKARPRTYSPEKILYVISFFLKNSVHFYYFNNSTYLFCQSLNQEWH